MQYTSKFSGEEIDLILDNVASKQDAIPDLETIRSNAKNASDTIARMVESGYLFAGIATIDTNPGIPDAKVFYIANGKGTYTNFGGIEVTEDEVVVLYLDSAWHKVATGIASQAKLSELEVRTHDLESDLEGGTEILIPIEIGTNTDNVGYFTKANGSLSGNASYRYYQPVDLSEYVGKTLKIEVEWGVAPASSYDNAICIFTKNNVLNSQDATAKGYVGEYALYATGVGNKATLTTTIEKPYLRISTHKNSACTILVNVVSTSVGRVPTLENKVNRLEDKTDSLGFEFIMPSYLYAETNRELDLYFDNIIRCDNRERYALDFSGFGNANTAKFFDDHIRIKFSSDGNYGCKIIAYDKITLANVAEKSFTLFVRSIPNDLSKKVMFIGDSLTEAAIYPIEIQHRISNGKIVCVGTRSFTREVDGTDYSVNVEGRGGWDTNDYMSKASSGSVSNPFFNPSTNKFDFAYYMANSGISVPDCVVFSLGTNDVGKNFTMEAVDSFIENMKAFVSSVNSYNGDICVLVNLIPPCCKSLTGWGKLDPAYYMYFVNEANKRLIELFDSYRFSNSVFVASYGLSIDRTRDFPTTQVPLCEREPNVIVEVQNNNVHPSNTGYFKMADALVGAILARS